MVIVMNNKKVHIKFMRLSKTAIVPQQMTDGAAGFDICADESCCLYPQRSLDKAYKVSTGIAIEIPKGYCILILLRSSAGANGKLRLANGCGLIDDDYRGEVKLIIENIGNSRYLLQKGERIAQMVVIKKPDVVFDEAQSLSDTKRGTGGIGSTGGEK